MGSTITPPQFAPGSTLPTDAPQYMQALEEANRVRLARAALKRRLAEQPTKRHSCNMCADVLADPPDVLVNMSVAELLMSCHRIGLVATRKILNASRVPELRKLSSLTSDQRQRLIGALRVAG